MGQAKRRGTLEQRIKAAIERDKPHSVDSTNPKHHNRPHVSLGRKNNVMSLALIAAATMGGFGGKR